MVGDFMSITPASRAAAFCRRRESRGYDLLLFFGGHKVSPNTKIVWFRLAMKEYAVSIFAFIVLK